MVRYGRQADTHSLGSLPAAIPHNPPSNYPVSRVGSPSRDQVSKKGSKAYSWARFSWSWHYLVHLLCPSCSAYQFSAGFSTSMILSVYSLHSSAIKLIWFVFGERHENIIKRKPFCLLMVNWDKIAGKVLVQINIQIRDSSWTVKLIAFYVYNHFQVPTPFMSILSSTWAFSLLTKHNL